ncbi:MAG TPA: bifunctional glutamate N-acetyltransferase/amino-acid acetyltransferase ArgJ [Armatimonadetes bacterium]|nr:bifunctional glutamate N-acetyltransferase/amino-acid acetyltransferase ArgJ [Armatimonadota bacterium]
MRKNEITFVEDGTITTPSGFLATGVSCGIKKRGIKDLALIYSEHPCIAVGTFTTNKLKAAPVIVTQENIRPAQAIIRAIVVNSGNANCCTGRQGIADARQTCDLVAKALDILPEQVVVASTGIIGTPLPMERLARGIARAARQLSRDGGLDAAEAIMTTDTVPKHAAVRFRIHHTDVHIGGIAKGAGMIAPHMATMLCFVTTDVAITKTCLKKALSRAVDVTFNSITVDGDTSTNDMVIMLSNGIANNERINSVMSDTYRVFEEALVSLLRFLAQSIVRDGEGATKLVEIQVHGALSEQEAKAVALTVANSNLVKCALFGNDPNWGRIAAAVGRSPARVSADRLAIWIGDACVMREGAGVPFDRRRLRSYMKRNSEIVLRIELGMGKASWTVWTCDLTYDYVRINAEYHT